MQIIHACAADASVLTEIALAAKRHWRYPEDWIRRWHGALTVTPEYIREHPTFVAIVDEQAVGFGALRLEGDAALLDHLWVLLRFMGRGIGRSLFEHAEKIARERGALRLKIVGDPHAESFYSRMGASVCGSQPASMDGQPRFLPLLEKAL